MTRRFAFALALSLLTAPLALAQGKPGDPKEETAETADGVKLRCRYYQAAKAGNNSVVILLHDYNADPEKGDWDGLARFLATDVGVHVMRFDFRGHGQSKDVLPRFWDDPWNQTKVSGFNKKKKDISVKDFKPDYYPMLVNDIAAVRNLIDLKNDDRTVNARTVYIIASGSAAPLAYLFLASEWHRQQSKPLPTGVVSALPDVVSLGGFRQPNTEVAGKDYAGVILLSPTTNYTYDSGTQKSTRNVSNSRIEDWATRHAKDAKGGGDLRGNSALLVFAGDKDETGHKTAAWYYHDLMHADGKGANKTDAMKNSKLNTIKGAKEKGVELLGKNNVFHTEDSIKTFLEKIEGDRKRLNPIDRKYDKPFRINLQSFGVSS